MHLESCGIRQNVVGWCGVDQNVVGWCLVRQTEDGCMG